MNKIKVTVGGREYSAKVLSGRLVIYNTPECDTSFLLDWILATLQGKDGKKDVYSLQHTYLRCFPISRCGEQIPITASEVGKTVHIGVSSTQQVVNTAILKPTSQYPSIETLRCRGFKEKSYTKKWSWMKFSFISPKTSSTIMEKGGESYCFENSGYVTHKNKSGDLQIIT